MSRLATLVVLLLTVNFKHLALGQNEEVSVDLDAPIWIVSDQFLSITIDSYTIQSNWYGIDLKSPQLLSLAKALAPAMLRIGGTAQDFILFSENNTDTKQSLSPKIDYNTYYSHKLKFEDLQNFVMSASQWDAVNEFALAVGWEITFGLNVFLRKHWPENGWNTTNAKQLMEYTISKGYQVNWELGNEPNQFPNTSEVTAKQLAKDYHTLSKLLQHLHQKPNYVAGPDITGGGDDFLVGFLENVCTGTLNAITWHHYYESGESAILPDFFNPDVLDRFLFAAEKIVIETLEYNSDKELWVGETSSCYDGGAPELSATYVAGFMQVQTIPAVEKQQRFFVDNLMLSVQLALSTKNLRCFSIATATENDVTLTIPPICKVDSNFLCYRWLDKLGLAAIINHTRVMRQTFIGGSYGLLDIDGTPLPDFWLSAVYKKIVGTRVLNVRDSKQLGRHVRVYAHCAKTPLYPAGSIVLIILNLNTFNTSITLTDQALVSSRRDVYWLTPPGGLDNIMSKQVTLNGELLELVDNLAIPELSPVQQEPSKHIPLPTLSFGFYVFKDAQAEGCMPA